LCCACSPKEDAQAAAEAAEIATKTCDGLAPYTVPGPYVAGVKTVEFAGTKMEIWYPADPESSEGLEPDRYDLRDWLPTEYRDRIPDEVDVGFVTDGYRDAPAATEDAPFPVVLFSHGLGGLRLQSSFLTTHLASWGMVVIAPEHVERNMTTVVWGTFETDNAPQTHRDVITNLPAIEAMAGLGGLLDRERIAMTGHSQGGATVSLVGADPEVSAWITMASNALPQSSMDNDIRDRPGLVMGGTADSISGGQERDQYDFLDANDKRLLLIDNAGHMAFTDFCPIAADEGGIFSVALEYGVPISEDIVDLVSDLVRDGCRADDLPIERAWPIIRHYATAHLLYAFGEADTAALEPPTTECFDADVDTLAHN
jgi:predicted dienelactone hydrolase